MRSGDRSTVCVHICDYQIKPQKNGLDQLFPTSETCLGWPHNWKRTGDKKICLCLFLANTRSQRCPTWEAAGIYTLIHHQSLWHQPVPRRSKGLCLSSLVIRSWASAGRASSPSGQMMSSGQGSTYQWHNEEIQIYLLVTDVITQKHWINLSWWLKNRRNLKKKKG